MLSRSYFVYLLASRRKGTLHVGVKNDLPRRVAQHKQGLAEWFTRKYGVKALVWYEQTDSIESAIAREKQIKKWNRAWKLRMIQLQNPDWEDLWQRIL